MTTSWLTARGAIAGILASVSITVPVATSIKRAFETEPRTIADFPCAVITGVTKQASRGTSGKRDKNYTVRFMLVANDADLATSGALLDALSEAAIDAFDVNMRLGLADNYTVAAQSFDQPTRANIGGTERVVMEGVIELAMKDSVSFAA